MASAMSLKVIAFAFGSLNLQCGVLLVAITYSALLAAQREVTKVRVRISPLRGTSMPNS